MFICLFPGSRVTTDQRFVAKQEIQEVESAYASSIRASALVIQEGAKNSITGGSSAQRTRVHLCPQQ